MTVSIPRSTLQSNVRAALVEDIGSGDITGQLIDGDALSQATILCREEAIICGRPWVDEVFSQIDKTISLKWLVSEGEKVKANQQILQLTGNTRSLVSAERTCLNFLQLLSGIATTCHHYAKQIKDSKTKLLDTRKTLPGLRVAQKYAVKIGGCENHRFGLFDAFLIKENHIEGCNGSISQAIQRARSYASELPVEVEVESLEELQQALEAKADIVMLDNFSLSDLHKAVEITSGRCKLEISGNVTSQTLTNLAKVGVDYISIGALTKNCQAIDLSMILERLN